MEAAFLVNLLNDPVCLSLVESMIFLGAKRPITKKLLQRIDLISLYNLVDKQAFIARGTAELELLEGTLKEKKAVWPSSMEDFLVEYFQNASITDGKKKIRTKGQVGQIHLFSDIVTAAN